jgi:hypothetical protein
VKSLDTRSSIDGGRELYGLKVVSNRPEGNEFLEEPSIVLQF